MNFSDNLLHFVSRAVTYQKMESQKELTAMDRREAQLLRDLGKDPVVKRLPYMGPPEKLFEQKTSPIITTDPTSSSGLPASNKPKTNRPKKKPFALRAARAEAPPSGVDNDYCRYYSHLQREGKHRIAHPNIGAAVPWNPS
jgi:hypothetical protein